jgi:predicted peptidase
MIWHLLTKNPNFYSRAVLACSPVIPSNKNLEKIANIPLWIVSAKKDPVVLYPTQKLLREKIKNTTKVPDKCRWTVFP